MKKLYWIVLGITGAIGTLLDRAIASNHPKEIQRRVVKLGEMG